MRLVCKYFETFALQVEGRLFVKWSNLTEEMKIQRVKVVESGNETKTKRGAPCDVFLLKLMLHTV